MCRERYVGGGKAKKKEGHLLIFRDPNLFVEYLYSKVLVFLFFKREALLKGDIGRRFSRTVCLILGHMKAERTQLGFMRKG